MFSPGNGTVHGEARRITRQRARSFFLASLFLPRAVQRDVHVIYAYYRTVDDLVDEPPLGFTSAEVHAELEHWNSWITGDDEGAPPLASELLAVARRHDVPSEYLTMVLEGGRWDLEAWPISTFDDLLRYSILVAGSVGMVMARVLGARHPAAEQCAQDLGVAMQITNILRDVNEDQLRGRVYLPTDVLQRYNCPPLLPSHLPLDPVVGEVIRELVPQARLLYRSGMAGVRYLPPNAQFSIYLATRLYAGILDKIERRNYDVLSGRARLGAGEKWLMVLPAYVEHRHLRLR